MKWAGSGAEKAHRVWTRTIWKLRGIQVFALVGKSGTGKSFRSALVADKHGIEVVLDDGLLIARGKIIAGRSAKREQHYLAAAKTACLIDPEHRQAIRETLRHERFHRILVLGTSTAMIDKILHALELPAPFKTIQIEDIATREEIEAAQHDRNKNGRHVIPLPVIELKRSYPKLLAESLTVWLRDGWRRRVGGHRKVEKSIVRPRFAGRGKLTVSEAALSQMILHCIAEQTPDYKVMKIRIAQGPAGCRAEVALEVPVQPGISQSLQRLHDTIVSEVESYAGVWIAKLNLSVESAVSPQVESKAAAERSG